LPGVILADAFYDKHFEEIQIYQDAKQYLEKIMNGKKTIPVTKWQAQQTELTAERISLCEDYYRLSDETKNAEILLRSAERLMRESKELEASRARDTAR